MWRFFADPSDIDENTIKLNSENSAHLRSLRLRPSEHFIVCDGNGTDYVCKLGEKAESSVATIIEKCLSQGESSVKCTVYIAHTKGERSDYAVHKSVELGAHEIVFFPSARCVAIPKNVEKKTARLQKISLEAAKLCNRGRVPKIKVCDSFKDAISDAKQADIPLLFYELENKLSLKEALEKASLDLSAKSKPLKTISIFIGPEGGFEPHEVDMAQNAGMITASLGVRILRNETAPVAALAAIMFFIGEM